jgi:hypothetical protein
MIFITKTTAVQPYQTLSLVRIAFTIDVAVTNSKPVEHVAAKTEDVPEFIPEISEESVFGLLLQLDSISDPGVTEKVFKQLVVRCLVCRRHMTRRTTAFHHCPGAGEGSVDVTDLMA